MKTVLITGACRNTGVDIVNIFAKEGYNVIFTGRNSDEVKNICEKYKKTTNNKHITGFCLKSLNNKNEVDEKSVEELFEKIDKMGCFVETLILNAANQGMDFDALDGSFEEFKSVINTNILWDYCLCKYAGNRMKMNGGGNIIFINSNTAYRAIPDRSAYITSKGGQLGLMRALAVDLGKYNIRVNAILPGMIKTDRWEKNPEFYKNVPSRFTPIGDVATGKDIAEAVIYFAKYARNTTGAELVIDGGNTVQLYPLKNNYEFY